MFKAAPNACLVIYFLGALQTLSAAPIGIGSANLNGANESPATVSSATGFASLTLDGNLLAVTLTFSGLTTPAAAAHIHCCTAPGTNTGVTVPFTAFPAATSGAYMNTFDLTMTSVYTATFIAANGGTAASAEAALLAGLASGQAYVNIHDSMYPGGEIRGFVVPEPATVAITGLGLGLLALVRRLRSR